VEVPVNDGDRKYLIAGNWKCNGTVVSNETLVGILNEAGPIPSNVEVAICCSDLHLPMLLGSLRDDIAVGAQDCGTLLASRSAGETGAFQIKDLGCTWVIVGHSERREGFHGAGTGESVCTSAPKSARSPLMPV
jgi:triosephosphate isomerase (TIM)